MPESYLSLDFTGFYAIRQVLPTIFLQWTTLRFLLAPLTQKVHGKRKIQ
jgi:hypothetical protein